MSKRSQLSLVLLTVAAATLAACGGGSSSPSSPEVPGAVVPARGATIVGTVSSPTGASDLTASSVSGLRVSVVGAGITAVTDGSGRFTLAGVPAGRVQLRFEGPGTDARVEVETVEGQSVAITVRVSGASATVVKPEDNGKVEFEGRIESMAAGSLVVGSRRVTVDGATAILDHDGRTIAFSSLKTGERVEVEGLPQPDGSVRALKVKREDEDDDGDDDGDDSDDDNGQDVEFTGTVQSLAPLTIGGRLVTTDSATRYLDRRNQAVAASVVLQVGNRVEVEGHASGNGVLAKKIKLEE